MIIFTFFVSAHLNGSNILHGKHEEYKAYFFITPLYIPERVQVGTDIKMNSSEVIFSALSIRFLMT